MEIKVISISDPVSKSKGKGKWNEFELEYSTAQGSKKRIFRSFDDIYNTVKAFKIGASYDVKVVKEGDYWKWTGAEELPEGAAPSVGTPARSGGGTDWNAKNALDRERFEFDKEKQPLIVRQSMVAAAVASLPQGSSIEDVLSRAQEFVDFVFDSEAVQTNNQIGEIE